jgi:hypothetical protein
LKCESSSSQATFFSCPVSQWISGDSDSVGNGDGVGDGIDAERNLFPIPISPPPRD